MPKEKTNTPVIFNPGLYLFQASNVLNCSLMPSLSDINPAGSISQSSPAPMKLAVVLDSLLVPGWVHYLIGKLISCKAIEPTLVIFIDDSKAAVGLDRGPILFRLWSALDRWVRRRRTDALQFLDWRLLLRDRSIPVMLLSTCNTHPSGIDSTVKAANFDLLLYLGSDIHGAEALAGACPTKWSVQQECLRGAAGVPGQFWDMYEGNRITRYGPKVIEQKQNQTSTVYCSSAATNFLSLALNQNTAYWEIADALVKRLFDAETLGMQLNSDMPASQHSTSRSLGSFRMAGFLVQWIMRIMRHELRKRLFREQWSIALQPKVDVSTVNFEHAVKILRPPRDHFYADPFLIERSGRNYLFFEDYKFSSRKGMISFCEVDAEGNCSEPRVVLERNYHLSYPFLFTWQGELYMIPETRDNGTIEMYRARDFPDAWVQEAVLMSDVAATDSTLLQYHGKWWLFTAGMLEHAPPHGTLWLFFAESPMGPWTAHPKNPIVSDPSCARPAGCLFFDNGELIRPGQDCTDSYGHATKLHRVNVLSETDYQESLTVNISPDQIPGSSGIHTFNQNAEFRVIDCKFMIPRFNFTFLGRLFRGLEARYDVLFAQDPVKNSR